MVARHRLLLCVEHTHLAFDPDTCCLQNVKPPIRSSVLPRFDISNVAKTDKTNNIVNISSCEEDGIDKIK